MIEFPFKTSPKLPFFYQFQEGSPKNGINRKIGEFIVPSYFFLATMLLYLQ